MKNFSARLLVGLLAFAVGVAAFAVWLFLRTPHPVPSGQEQLAGAPDAAPEITAQGPPYYSRYENPVIPAGSFYVARDSGGYIMDAEAGNDGRALVISYDDKPIKRSADYPDAPTLPGFYLSYRVRLDFEMVKIIHDKVYFSTIGTGGVSYEFSGVTGEEIISHIDDSKPVPFIKGILTKSTNGKVERVEEIKFRHTIIAR